MNTTTTTAATADELHITSWMPNKVRTAAEWPTHRTRARQARRRAINRRRRAARLARSTK